MKLKSILTLAMVAILAMAGGAMAATTTTTNTNTDIGGASLGHTPGGMFGVACAGLTGGVTNCAAMSAANITAFVTDLQVGATTSGTGLAGGMPAQVTYAANQYTGGVGPNSGYALNANLFGMCAGNGTTTGTITEICPKFVPAAGSVGLAAIGVTGFMPTGVDGFNEATFETGIVSGFSTVGVMTNQFSQQTAHHSFVTGGTLLNTDGDYIDQRLSQVIGTNQTLNQSTQIGGSSGTSVVVTVDTGAQQAGWLLNTDLAPPVGSGLQVQNGGTISQAVADNFSGGFGDYGQKFANTDVSVTNNITLAGPSGAATTYNATAPGLTGTPGGALSLP